MVEMLIDITLTIGTFIHGTLVELSVTYTLYKAIEEFHPDLVAQWKQKIRDFFNSRG